MSDKKRLVHGYIFDSDNALARFQLENAVHQKERGAVRQNLLDLVDVKGHGAPIRNGPLLFRKRQK